MIFLTRTLAGLVIWQEQGPQGQTEGNREGPTNKQGNFKD